MLKERIDVHGHYFPPAYQELLQRHHMEFLDGVKAPATLQRSGNIKLKKKGKNQHASDYIGSSSVKQGAETTVGERIHRKCCQDYEDAGRGILCVLEGKLPG